MVSTRFSNFVLVFILLQASDSTAYIHQGLDKRVDGKVKKFEVSEDILVNGNKENEVGSTKFGGRKIKLERVMKNEMLKDENTSIGNSKISGMDLYASKKHTGNTPKHLEGQSKNIDLEASSVATVLMSEKQDPKQQNIASENIEPQKLLEAAREIAYLMNKDYPGNGGARHKPPTNNYEPLSQEHQPP